MGEIVLPRVFVREADRFGSPRSRMLANPVPCGCPLTVPHEIGVTKAESSQTVVEPLVFQKLTPGLVQTMVSKYLVVDLSAKVTSSE